ncbi:MAG: hypothetical protein ACFCU3_12315 [Verrucomicrobiales bacterium]
MKTGFWGLTLFAALIAGINFILLWIGLFVAAPKVIGLYGELHEALILPDFARLALQNSPGLLHLFWPSVVFASSLFLLSCIVRLPFLVRSVSRGLLVALSLILLAYNALLYISVFVASHELHWAQHHKTKIFAQVLEELALLEAAEDRWEETQQRMAALAGIAQRRIESAAELTRSARSARVTQLVEKIKQVDSPDLQKRLFATLGMFREDVPRFEHNERFVSSAAGRLANRSFSSSSEFFEWLDRNRGQDGWKPVPLYVFTADERATALPGASKQTEE